MNKVFKCDLCNEDFELEQKLNTHFANTHVSRDFIQGVIQKHRNIKSTITKKDLKCEICDINFAKKCDLNRHTSTKHQNNSKFKFWNF